MKLFCTMKNSLPHKIVFCTFINNFLSLSLSLQNTWVINGIFHKATVYDHLWNKKLRSRIKKRRNRINFARTHQVFHVRDVKKEKKRKIYMRHVEWEERERGCTVENVRIEKKCERNLADKHTYRSMTMNWVISWWWERKMRRKCDNINSPIIKIAISAAAAMIIVAFPEVIRWWSLIIIVIFQRSRAWLVSVTTA